MRSVGFELIGLYTRHAYSATLHKTDLRHAAARDDVSADRFCRGKGELEARPHAGYHEGNAYWRRNDTQETPPPEFRRDI
jgi:hypothetical protein